MLLRRRTCDGLRFKRISYIRCRLLGCMGYTGGGLWGSILPASGCDYGVL